MSDDNFNGVPELAHKGLLYPCTDTGNSQRFIDQNKNDIKFIRELKKWVRWDGTRWNLNENEKLTRAKKTAQSIFAEARQCKNTQGQQELYKWAHASQSEGRLNSMLNLSKDELGESLHRFDTDPYAINCKNGLVNLKTGELTPHNPDMLLMKRTRVKYNPSKRCHHWEKFVSEIFNHDTEMVDWIQRALGYSITGSVSEQVFFILHGQGENGKSKLINTICDIVGDYGTITPFDIFQSTGGSNLRGHVAIGDLKGIRFAVASEAGNEKWDEKVVKTATGGDKLRGAKLYCDYFDFDPTHHLYFLTNRLPAFKDGSHGFKRRIRVVPFMVIFSGEKRDKNIADRFDPEGVFSWLVEGALRYHEIGLDDTPAIMQEATEDYIMANDTLGVFISDCLVRDIRSQIGASEMYDLYLQWCETSDISPDNKNFFPQNMEERGVARKRTNKGQVYTGYRIKLAEVTQPPRPSLNDFRRDNPSAMSYGKWEKNGQRF
ncbi:MAG: hypothetical protein C0519_00565 [Hyphomicrobium sp.]|nr:hypothetical protein [Hyphomicrobium sp.]PPD08018.1 MAG: hypothetical protein CTY28_06990 [Hyphomicrobium sp.]